MGDGSGLMPTVAPVRDADLAKLYRYLVWLAGRRGYSEQVCEDIASDAMLVCIERNIFDWKFAGGVLRNKGRVYRHKRRKEVDLDEESWDGELKRLAVPPNQDMAYEVSEFLRAAAHLSQLQKNAIYLKAQEYSDDEAASVLGITLPALKHRIFSARRLLREKQGGAKSNGRYKGVRKRGHRFAANIFVRSGDTKKLRCIYLGMFATAREASAAYEAAALIYHRPAPTLSERRAGA